MVSTKIVWLLHVITSAISYYNTNRVMLTLTVHEQWSKPANKIKLRDLLPFVSGTLQEVSERGYYIIKIQVIKLPVFNLLLCLKVKSPERHLTQSNIAIAVRSILSLLFTLTVIHFRMVNTSDYKLFHVA